MRKPVASRQFVPVVLDNAWVVEHRAGPAGVLRFAPARIAASFRFLVKHTIPSEGMATVACLVRVADAEGRLWQAESVFTPRALLEKLIDLSRRQAPYWLESAPEEWRRACRQRVLMRGIGHASDDRGHHWFYFDGTAFYWRFKHFGITFDIIHLEGTRLLIRIAHSYGSWAAMPIEGPDGQPQSPPPRPERDEDEEEDEDEDEEMGGWLENLDPMVYELDCRELLFHNTAYLQTDGFEMYRENEIPIPVVFRRVKGEGQPQPAVTFQPARSVRSAEGRARPAGPFEETSFENRCVVELPVRSGGHLRLGAGCVEMSFHLGLVPESASEPVDVVRCLLRVADDHGDLWQAEGLFTPEVFLERMVDVGERQPLADKEARQRWKKAEKAGLLLSGVRGVLEGPRYLLTEDRAVAIVGTGQRPRYDVASDGLVRVTGLTGVRWPLEVIAAEEYAGLAKEALGQSVEEKALPPLVYHLDFRHLLFRNTTFAVDDGFWHRNDLPIPMLFERVEGKGKKQPEVHYVPEGE
jgi:hypothetical protein